MAQCNCISTTDVGVWGASQTSTGAFGGSNSGWGVHGVSQTNTAIVGMSTNGWGIHGISGPATGVVGQSTGGFGIHGMSKTNTAIVGASERGNGVHGISDVVTGVVGQSTYGWGIHGISKYNTAIVGVSDNAVGVHGIGRLYGVRGESTRTAVHASASMEEPGMGVAAYGYYAVYAYSSRGYAGLFVGKVSISGDLAVTGWISKGGGGFRIDHPRDPANKYLNHSFVESSKMTNFYDGIVTLDEDGIAWVDLPEWFEVLNGDFRYQLTAVGGAAPNLHVAEEIYGNHRFKIAGGKGGNKVCWQVTGSRKDAWAAANPIKVEEEKPPQDRGRYLHPHLYNASPEQTVMAGSMDARELQKLRQGPPQTPEVPSPPQAPEVPSGFKPPEAPELPPSYVFKMQAEHLRESNELRQQIEELKRNRREEEDRRQIDELRRQIEELRRR